MLTTALQRSPMGNKCGGRLDGTPVGVPRVRLADVLAAADAAGVEVKRPKGAWSMWWVRRRGDTWRTLARTNYLARRALGGLGDEAAAVGALTPEVSVMVGRDFYDEVHRLKIATRLRYLSTYEGDIARETDFVARVGERIVGAAGIQQSPEEADVLWLVFVSVDEGFRELGIGSALAGAVFVHARKTGMRIRASSYHGVGGERMQKVMERLALEHPDVGFKDGSDHYKFDR